MTIVVDASVAVKWLVTEDDSTAAVRLCALPLAAPDLLSAEVASIMWKKVRRGEVTPAIAQAALLVLAEMGIGLVPGSRLAGKALSLACELDHSPYDMFYVALAIERDIPLVTADNRLINKVQQVGFGWARLVTPLTESKPGAFAPSLS
ncbi:type II toxin-antitoxin system VapC family toxin [Niveispirillum sp.]|uniref:type II toxin-antitoxin system VapC family toxin n=1 Tax=Niveispirillum sp. TaxID=1917217 RepID=UPI001B4BE848|nr:type II toxin-antitoxin system VapC family toxin [Niveispirillum sp.]MBP7337522.1 type II toxin-antitoxin system VapC family toxin [Niveispirillum sp.]